MIIKNPMHHTLMSCVMPLSHRNILSNMKKLIFVMFNIFKLIKIKITINQHIINCHMALTLRYQETPIDTFVTAPLDTYYVDTGLISRITTREERKREFDEDRFQPKYSSKPFMMSDHVKLQEDEYAIRFNVVNNNNIVEVRDSSNCVRDYRGTPTIKCDFAEFKSSVCTCSNLLYRKYDSGDFYYVIVTNFCNVYYVWLTPNKPHCIQEEPNVNVKMIVSTNIKMSEMLIDMTLISVNYKRMSDLVIRHYGTTSPKYTQIVDLLQQSIDNYRSANRKLADEHAEMSHKLTKTKTSLASAKDTVMTLQQTKKELVTAYEQTIDELNKQLSDVMFESKSKTSEIERLHSKLATVKNFINDIIN